MFEVLPTLNLGQGRVVYQQCVYEDLDLIKM